MFFDQPQIINIDKYSLEKWVSLEQVSESINENEKILIHGFGFFNYKEEGQFSEFLGYYLLKINDRLFGFCGESIDGEVVEENKNIRFKHVIEFNNDLLNSAIFEGSQFKRSTNYYTSFKAELLVEAKSYLDSDEEKLFFSKKGQGQIDLYCSYHIKNKDNDFACKIHPSAFSAAKHLAMSKILDERIKKIQESKP